MLRFALGGFIAIALTGAFLATLVVAVKNHPHPSEPPQIPLIIDR